MKLPYYQYTDGIEKVQQTGFGGINHTIAARNGEMYDCINFTSDNLPVLSTRKKRRTEYSLTQEQIAEGYELCGLFSDKEKLGKVLGKVGANSTEYVFYNALGETCTTTAIESVQKARDQTAVKINKRVVFYPLGVVLDPNNMTIEKSTPKRFDALKNGYPAVFADGTLGGTAAAKNTIWYGMDGTASTFWEAGDIVTISGCATNSDGIDLSPNNKTATVREVEVRFNEDVYSYCTYLRFDANTWVNGSAYAEGIMPVVIESKIGQPDLEYIAECNNRLWACKGDTIYASALGNPTEWETFEGLETDSWTVDTGTDGDFTGCINYNGYPTFFKKNVIFRVYGSTPSTFRLVRIYSFGVAEQASKSLAVAGGVLIYLSESGFMIFDGSMPIRIQAPLGQANYINAVACSDGIKYYCEVEYTDGQKRLLIYDTEKGTWLTENALSATTMARISNQCYAITEKETTEDVDGEETPTGEYARQEIKLFGQDTDGEGTEEETLDWSVSFADFDENEPDKKGVSKIMLRIELGTGATAKVYVSYDSGEWETNPLLALQAGKKRSYYLPLIPRRADHYKIKIEGSGQCNIYTLTREEYIGSELRSTEGRN